MHKCTQRECRHTPSKIQLTTEVELTNNYSNPLPVTANREMNIVSVISVALSVWMSSVFIMGSFTDRGEESLNTHAFIKGATSPFSHPTSTWTTHPGQKVGSTVVTIAGGSAFSSTHKQIFRSLKTACSFCLTSSFVCDICLCNLMFKNNSDKWPT